MEERGAAEHEDKKRQQLPTESIPYTRYKDLVDYKLQGYGTQGHQPPVDQPSGGGGTDAPTLSGSGLSQGQAAQAQTTDTINRQGVP